MENIIEILDHFLHDPWMFNSGPLIRVIKLFIPACLKDMTSRRWNFPFPQLPLLRCDPLIRLLLPVVLQTVPAARSNQAAARRFRPLFYR